MGAADTEAQSCLCRCRCPVPQRQRQWQMFINFIEQLIKCGKCFCPFTGRSAFWRIDAATAGRQTDANDAAAASCSCNIHAHKRRASICGRLLLKWHSKSQQKQLRVARCKGDTSLYISFLCTHTYKLIVRLGRNISQVRLGRNISQVRLGRSFMGFSLFVSISIFVNTLITERLSDHFKFY